MNKALTTIGLTSLVAIGMGLTGCTTTYVPPANSANTAKFVYSNDQKIQYRAQPVNCADAEDLPLDHSFWNIFKGGDPAEMDTTLPAGQLVSLVFDGASIPQPQLNTNNQIAGTALSLLTKGAMGGGVSKEAFANAAQQNCSFMVSFVPESGAFYRYKMGASNVDTTIGAANYKCYFELTQLKNAQWVPVPVFPRDPSNVSVNGLPVHCSSAGFETQLQQSDMKGLPMTTNISRTFSASGGNAMETSIG